MVISIMVIIHHRTNIDQGITTTIRTIQISSSSTDLDLTVITILNSNSNINSTTRNIEAPELDTKTMITTMLEEEEVEEEGIIMVTKKKQAIDCFVHIFPT
mmetsp:Transcript_43378/g.49228  ORF Transcript_43378/g.49228 Transcript_43378/m.49228 type:complete len:101 (-) Transcript_43378:76-378(-)